MALVSIQRQDGFEKNPDVVVIDGTPVLVNMIVTRHLIPALEVNVRFEEDPYLVISSLDFRDDGDYKSHKLNEVLARPQGGTRFDPKANAWVKAREKELRKRIRAAARTAVDQYVASDRYRSDMVKAHTLMAKKYARKIDSLEKDLAAYTFNKRHAESSAQAWKLKGDQHVLALKLIQEDKWDGTPAELLSTVKGALA